MSDETWSAFRAGLGSTPASAALGRLVEREVARRRRGEVADPRAVREAVAEAKDVAAELAALIARLDGGGVTEAHTLRGDLNDPRERPQRA